MVVVAILWIQLGASSLAGIGTLLLVIPIQAWFGKFFAYMRYKDRKLCDKTEYISKYSILIESILAQSAKNHCGGVYF